MSKIGVIIGRFQVAELHSGHIELINTVFEKSDRVIFILGEARVPLTANNPLPFVSRQQMIAEHAVTYTNKPYWAVLKINDCKDNKTWSENLDTLISKHSTAEDEVVLYTGRDGFNLSYLGKYPVTVLPEDKRHSPGTKYRENIAKSIVASKNWREGVIYATQNKYPASHQTTDTVIIKKETGEILLGRKPAEQKFRMVGGFVDPSDETLERAAKREVIEECSIGMETDNYQYICSYRVKDWRFEHEKDKIMTAFFVCNYIFGFPKASDDIAEVKWFKIDEITEDMIEPEHKKLLQELKFYLKKLSKAEKDARFEKRKTTLESMGFTYNETLAYFSMEGIWGGYWEQIYEPTDEWFNEYLDTIKSVIKKHSKITA